ncbi:hypothetical protein N7523_007459 [Penicillium sp. IBT 18751x]|uniref:uncharacterized protein n=1 Tax=Penicillium maclennaniae TaxID=1343394 RepID=UPI00253F9D05|nr:uncharacterized protein N7477_006313 [Penicillium maclennaniae]KAJ5667743.1 hypothetical protein N7477_006313 [Penicillium maclennaniae]KAJ6111398.1 hypothetical protein N7523_007459 [Penicillium sp. IBT 18751x]
MRLSLRIGSAAVLIILGFILFNRRVLPKGPHPSSFWHFDTTDFRSVFHPRPSTQDSSRRKWGSGTGHTVELTYQNTPIVVPDEGIIVIGKLREEDTTWVSQELAEWRNFIYTVDDTSVPNHTPKNKGREALPYLQFLVDHYDDLPAIVVFVHAHRGTYETAWHVDSMDYNNVDSIRALQHDFVRQEGFVNLRCQLSPGCPEEMQPFRQPPKPGDTGEKHYAAAWKEIFGNSNVPEKIAAPCCSQFAVSREQVLQRPRTDYLRMYNWVLNNDLSDEVTANIMEYMWHIIFGKDPIFCPDVFQCYADVFGEEVIF